MTITAFPFDNQDTTEAEFGFWARELQYSGIADSSDGSGFKVSADASGMHVFVQPGRAFLRGTMADSDAVETVPIEAPDTLPRLDRVVLRLDPTLNTTVLAVVKGTPGASAPALTRTDTDVHEEPLAIVTVAPGIVTVAATAVAEDRRFVGGFTGSWTTDTRPLAPRLHGLGYNKTSGVWEFFDGTTWKPHIPIIEWGNISGRPAEFPPGPHTHMWADITNAPASMPPSPHTHPWDQVTDKPVFFTPDAHTHWATEIRGGVFPISLFPLGNTAQEVAVGNHAHAWGEIQDKPSSFKPSSHSHGQYLTSGETISWANGSRRVRGNQPEDGSRTWYKVWIDGNDRFCKWTSSRRYKENIRPAEQAGLDPHAVLKLRPVVFDRKPGIDPETGEAYPPRRDELGLIAEEVAEVLPHLAQCEDGQVESYDPDMLTVAMLPILREMHDEIESLKARVAELEAR